MVESVRLLQRQEEKTQLLANQNMAYATLKAVKNKFNGNIAFYGFIEQLNELVDRQIIIRYFNELQQSTADRRADRFSEKNAVSTAFTQLSVKYFNMKELTLDVKK